MGEVSETERTIEEDNSITQLDTTDDQSSESTRVSKCQTQRSHESREENLRRHGMA